MIDEVENADISSNCGAHNLVWSNVHVDIKNYINYTLNLLKSNV